MTVVQAPGSSANVGPGFDVLGIAIGRHAWVSDEGPLGRSGRADTEPCGPDHIARIAHRAAGGTGDIWFDFDLRPGRGMGFSGAARAAGAVLAGLQQGLAPADVDAAAYEVVVGLEGHGDNAAPSVHGGIHVVTGLETLRLSTALPGHLLLWVPDLQSATDESRASLPTSVPMVDAVFNVGRAALLVAALYERRPDLLARATDDRLHQPTRLAALPASAAARSAALESGALASWLSGSGPSVAVLVGDESVDAVVAALPADGEVLRVDVDERGAVAV
jgi:homoserine kinase